MMQRVQFSGRTLSTSSVTPSRRDAAARVLDAIHGALGQNGVLGELLRDQNPFTAGEHYPAGEVWDPETHAQYYYHAHASAAAGRADGAAGSLAEHGHFHTFLGAAGMPAGVAPLILPEMALAPPLSGPSTLARLATERVRRERGPVSHLIGITLDTAGRPIGLFTTNRWVTGETWYRAADVSRMLDAFVLNVETPSQLVNRWLMALIAFYRDEIVTLIEARDEAVMEWRRRRRGRLHVFDDRRLEVTSSLTIDFATDLTRSGGHDLVY